MNKEEYKSTTFPKERTFEEIVEDGQGQPYYIQRDSNERVLELLSCYCCEKRCVLLFSKTMDRETLVGHLLCRRAGVDYYNCLENKLTDSDMKAIIEARDKLSGLPLFVHTDRDNKVNSTMATIKKQAHAWYCKNQAEIHQHNAVIIIDHYDLLLHATAMADESNDHTLDEQLVMLAEEIPVQVCCLVELDDAQFALQNFFPKEKRT